MADDEAPKVGSPLEQRMWTIVMGVCLALGGWWLQNQYETMLRIQTQVSEFTRFVDSEYVDRKYLERVQIDTERRLNSIEGKIDHLLEMQAGSKMPPTEMQR